MANEEGRIGLDPQALAPNLQTLRTCTDDLETLKTQIKAVAFSEEGGCASNGPAAYYVASASARLSGVVATMQELIAASVAHLEDISEDITEAGGGGV